MSTFSAKACDLPPNALLLRYQSGNYTDCFTVEVPGTHDLADFVAAFYTTWLFKAERAVLTVLAKSPATDAEAIALGRGEVEQFSVWTTEERSETQLLMCPRDKTTRSWFMVSPGANTTSLYFGSALLLSGQAGFWLKAVIPLHRLYSMVLLSRAQAKLRRTLNP